MSHLGILRSLRPNPAQPDPRAALLISRPSPPVGRARSADARPLVRKRTAHEEEAAGRPTFSFASAAAPPRPFSRTTAPTESTAALAAAPAAMPVGPAPPARCATAPASAPAPSPTLEPTPLAKSSAEVLKLLLKRVQFVFEEHVEHQPTCLPTSANVCQILEGSFSAVSKRMFANKYAFCSIFQILQYLHTFAPLQTQFFTSTQNSISKISDFGKISVRKIQLPKNQQNVLEKNVAKEA